MAALLASLVCVAAMWFVIVLVVRVLLKYLRS